VPNSRTSLRAMNQAPKIGYTANVLRFLAAIALAVMWPVSLGGSEQMVSWEVEDAISEAVFTPDGKYFVYADDNGERRSRTDISALDLTSGKSVRVARLDAQAKIESDTKSKRVAQAIPLAANNQLSEIIFTQEHDGRHGLWSWHREPRLPLAQVENPQDAALVSIERLVTGNDGAHYFQTVKGSSADKQYVAFWDYDARLMSVVSLETGQIATTSQAPLNFGFAPGQYEWLWSGDDLLWNNSHRLRYGVIRHPMDKDADVVAHDSPPLDETSAVEYWRIIGCASELRAC
jgi:hypothetical protein